MESQNNKTLDDIDKVVGKFLKHYFHFFKLPEFVPRKWLKKYKSLLRSIYELRIELQAHISDKDAALEDLNIETWVATIESYITVLRGLLTDLTEIDDENKKAVLENFDSEAEILEADLKGILENQEAYPWYTGDGTSPVAFIDMTGVNNSVIDVGVAGGTTTAYTGGRVYAVLPNTYSFKITPNTGYVCERTVVPTVLNFSGSYSFNYNDTNFTFTLTLTDAYNGTTIYIGYNPNAQNYYATLLGNVSGAYFLVNNLVTTSTELQLPAAVKLSLVDYDGYANGDTPTITGYTGNYGWYKSGDNWTFQDTFGTEYDGKILTVNYNAVPLIYHNVKIDDVNNAYTVYINGTQCYSADVETADPVEIVCYVVDGFTVSGLPVIVSGIEQEYVTRTALEDEETGEQAGWSISFRAADMTGDVEIEVHATGQIVSTDYRIYWNNNDLDKVNIILGGE